MRSVTLRPLPVYSLLFLAVAYVVPFAQPGVTSVQESGVRVGTYLGGRGRYDPRPLPDSHVYDGLIRGPALFQEKNRRWIKKGFALGGCASVNTQNGRADGPLHIMSETLITGVWEPLPRDSDAGRWCSDRLTTAPSESRTLVSLRLRSTAPALHATTRRLALACADAGMAAKGSRPPFADWRGWPRRSPAYSP